MQRSVAHRPSEVKMKAHERAPDVGAQPRKPIHFLRLDSLRAYRLAGTDNPRLAEADTNRGECIEMPTDPIGQDGRRKPVLEIAGIKRVREPVSS